MPARDPSAFGDLLRQHRRAAGLTQEALAERAGVSVRAIVDLERGVIRAPRRDTLELLASALELSPEDHRRWREIRARSSARPAPSGEQTSRRTTLPHAPNPLLGRETELDQVAHLLRDEPDARLVTLTGPAGVGKTRLALELGARLEQDFRDGACFVDLAQIDSPELVLGAIARSVELTGAGDQTLRDQLRAYLATRTMLLIVDNFEHILPAATDVADLLAATSDITFLVTSRSRLQLRGEYDVPLAPLSVPGHKLSLTAADAELFPAIQLFAQRSQQARPDFTLTADNISAIVEICSRLDGLPLAIELAAARIKVLSPDEMLPRLENQLHLLSDGFQDLPDRHRTMRGAIEWSYQFLSLRQKELFRRIAIFAGGCSLDAIQAISPSGVDVLDDLTALVDSSLIYQTELPDGRYRFGMLEPIRAYALDRLFELSEAARVRQAHANYYLELVEAAESGLRSPDQSDWLDVLALEMGNIRLATEWASREDIDTEFWLRLGGALNIGISHVVPVEVETELGLRLTPSRDATQGAPGEIPSEHYLFIPEIARQANDRAIRQKALAGSGWLAGLHGDLASGRALLAESLELAIDLDDRPAIAWALHLLGRQYEFHEDTSLAPDYYQRSIEEAEAIGDDWITAWSHHRLGFFHHAFLNDVETAQHHYGLSLEIRQRIGYREGVSVIWALLGIIRLSDGDHDSALGLFHQALEVLHDLRARWLAVIVIANCVPLAVSFGEPERAARLGSFCTTTMDVLGRQSLPLSDDRLRNGIDQASDTLASDIYQRAAADGRVMSLQAAIGEALLIGRDAGE